MKKDNNTKSFVLRVDSETMAAIEKWAADEFRSTNGQLQWIISEALRKSGRLPKKKRARKDEGKENEEGHTVNCGARSNRCMATVRRVPLPTMCWMYASDCRRLTSCAEPLRR